jgi:hypothetical protein
MAGRSRPVADEIARRLGTAPVPGSPNRITATELRDWAVEYLGAHDDEMACTPEMVGQTHSTLWMMDTRFEDALFAVLVFHSHGIDFFCGTGDSFDVRDFCDHEWSDDPAELFEAMRKRFRIPEDRFVVNRQRAERWLGRSW